MFKRKFRDSKREPRNLTKIMSSGDAKRPEKESMITQESDLLFKKTTSGLPKSGSSITVKADPYAQVLPGNDPYALLNSANVKAGGAYIGEDNLDGGITNQIIGSELSNFLHSFDSLMVRCKVNYRYLPIISSDTERGAGIVREMIQAIDEVLSVAKSTTYTQLAINQYSIKSSLPRLDRSTGKLVENDGTAISCGTAEGLFELLVCYQVYLQSFAGIFNSYNKFRANQGTMLRMSWNRETPALNSYFSLMNKNSMVGQFKSLAYVLNGEYFDQEWMRQFNMIASLTSRRSNAMVDPLKEVVCTHNLPQFELLVSSVSNGQTVDTSIFDSKEFDQLLADSQNTQLNTLKYSEAVDYVTKRLSINDTLYWVRNKQAYSTQSEQSRFNAVCDFVNILQAAASIFKPAMGDLRTMLDVIQRVGANAWTKSTMLEVFDTLDTPVMHNLTVDDLYMSLLGGAAEMKWDSNTFRWSVYTPWNYFFGIPEYDAKSGGCFLTFSTKKRTGSVNFDNATDYLPVLISGLLNEPNSETRGGMVYAINRLGLSVELAPAEFNPKDNPTSARLVPISSINDIKLKIPYTATALDQIDRSFLQSACLKAFGSFSNANTNVVNASTDLAINPDILCYISIEINDLSNEMITYARSKGPFIVNFDKESTIGFIGLTR